MGALTFILLCPLMGAAAVAVTPRSFRVLFRLIALVATFLSLVAAVWVFSEFETGTARIQFEEYTPWVYALGIGYHVGVDGLNVGLVLMAALVAFGAVCVAHGVREREKEFYLLLLLIVTGAFGAFTSLDLFFIYFFHELALVPTFVMIGVWGRGEQRDYATFQITLYLSLGALIALLGLIALYVAAGGETFDALELGRRLAAEPLSPGTQGTIFGLLVLGLGILASLWPFHTWAPPAYAAAPTPVSMLHAGVLKKFGLYALLRIAVPLLPEGAERWVGLVAWLCLGNLLYCGLVAMRQRNLNLLLGNSSVAHMGFVFLGIASLSLVGLTGAVVVMVAHGLLAALAFALSGRLEERLGTVETDRMGGLLREMPFVGALLTMAMFAACGLPGFANFPGEALVFFGAWEGRAAAVVMAVWAALVIGAVYALRAVRVMLHGPVSARETALRDAPNAWRKLPFVLLTGALLLFGCFPRLLTDRIQATAIGLAQAVGAPDLTNSGRSAEARGTWVRSD